MHLCVGTQTNSNVWSPISFRNDYKITFILGAAGTAKERASNYSGEEKSASKGERKRIQRSKSKIRKGRSSQKRRNEKVFIFFFIKNVFLIFLKT